MSLGNQFIARFFSGDSFKQHPENTLNNFTVELDQILDLGDDDWMIGVCEYYLNPIINHNPSYSHDIVNLSSTKNNFTDFQTFVSYVLIHSSFRHIYTKDYFAKYLSSKLHFSDEGIQRVFKDDILQNFVMDNGIKFEFDLKTILEPNEKIKDFITINRWHTVTNDMLKVEFTLPLKPNTLTMKQILNLMIKQLLVHFTANNKDSVNVAAEFITAHLEKSNPNGYNSLEKAMDAKHLFWKSIDMLIHRFIKKFVELIQNSNSVALLKQNIESKYIFIYCDAILHQQVGPIKSRLLYVTKHPDEHHHSNFKTVDYIQYAKLEKTKLKTISFQLTDEHGELINFNSSTASTYIALQFRKTSKK